VDRIDRQITHCLQRNGRAPFRVIAEAIDVSEQTVARRFRGLLESGAIRVIGLPDAQAGGLDSWFVRIQCRPDSADALADALASRDDVAYVTVTSGGGELTCTIVSNPEAAHGSILLHRLPKTNQVLSFTAYSVLHMHVGGDAEWTAFDDPLTEAQLALLGTLQSGPKVPVRLQDDDAPLLAELARDGRASVASLTRATGWPASRVAGRMEELLTSGAVYVDLEIAPGPFGFHSIAYLWCRVAPGELAATGEALALHPETSFAAAVTGAANLLSVVACRDSADLYNYVTTKVGALPAIREVEIVPTLRRVKHAGTLMRGGRLVSGPARAAAPLRPRAASGRGR
jgi:DNA-binding Lrp family transcriptional regulator